MVIPSSLSDGVFVADTVAETSNVTPEIRFVSVCLQVAPMNREAWWRLGRCRLELEDFRGACGPLTHVLKGWPTHPANAAAWRALVQAALAAGKKEVASEALQGWLQSASGSADAALSLGGGGRVNTSHLEQELAVSRRTLFINTSKVWLLARATPSN